MARLERFHTFEAEVSGQLNEKIANEAKVQHLSLEIDTLETTHPKNRMHEVEIAERLKELKQTRMEYTDCSTQYLLDVIPHIRAYSDCCRIMSETPVIGTPQRYTMGSVYKNYQKQYNRKDNFGSTSQTCDMSRCALGICDRCHHSNMIFDSVTSTNVCEECGNSVNVIMNETVNATFGQTGIVQTKYAYKRINHFNEWLNTFQAKETATPSLKMLPLKESVNISNSTSSTSFTNTRHRLHQLYLEYPLFQFQELKSIDFAQCFRSYKSHLRQCAPRIAKTSHLMHLFFTSSASC
jgi:hypothetical protein